MTTQLKATDTQEAPLSPRASFLEGVFRLTRSHDKVSQQLHHEAYRYYLMGKEGASDWIDDALFNDYEHKVIEVCAIVTEAAARRIPSDFCARLLGAEAFLSMDKSDLEQFLRPIFEESGIGDRFEVRQAFEVYTYDH